MFTIDIKDIKKYLSEDTDRVEKLLGYFDFHGFNYTKEALRCAVPDGDNTSSVVIYLSEYLNGIVYTRGSYKGDIFKIIQYITGRKISEIFTITRSLFGLPSQGSKVKIKRVSILKDLHKYKKKKEYEHEIKFFDKKMLNQFIMLPHEELFEEAIMPFVCRQFDVCYDHKSDRIIFPHYHWDKTDKIVGLQGRKVGMSSEEAKLLGVPKYINIIEGYRKSENLYGWNQSIENVKKEKMLILFEGEKSVLKEFTLKRGSGISAALGGYIISDSQIKIIAQNTPLDTEVVLALDRDVMYDEIKYKEAMKQAEKLKMFRKVSYIKDRFPVGKILGEKDSPVDNGLLVFNFLMEHRERL